MTSTERQMPKQARGRAAVASILAAASELLEEAGFDSLTTATIATRAGVNIATLYRYYPNKFAIVRELAQSIEEERSGVALEALAELGVASDWREPVRRAVRAMAQLRRDRSGATAIRRALQSSPELWHLDHDVNAATATAIAPFLLRVNPALAEERAQAIALTVVHTVASLLDLAAGERERALGLERELELVVINYLAPELDRA
ncbi:TetR family transcriptional regulator [Leucobacter komagatae]|uniref:TetR family transcriptional regulator n=2 Tax=Leucobacter komagatae TaxID=55969 RepID=A0A542Y235_9MICO|nr:TetR family transcriptional regulator [Leucobacter komagatae]